MDRSLRDRLLGILLVMGATILGLAGCNTSAPEGDPIDLESSAIFKDFTLVTLEGEERSLKDFLGTATLVSFFFPT